MNIATARQICVVAFLEAHRQTLTPIAQRKAFEACGFAPFDPMNPLSSEYVQPGRFPGNDNTRFLINGMEATSPQIIMAIRNNQMGQRIVNQWHISEIDVKQFQNHMMSTTQAEGRLLTPFESKLIQTPVGMIISK